MTVNPYRPADPAIRGDWREQARCITTDPDLFHPSSGHEKWMDRGRVAQAKSVCGRCTVIAECLEWAMNEDQGVAGGLTAAERRNLRAAS